MRLCAALALVLVASLVLAIKVVRRPRHHAATTAAAEGVEPAPSSPVPQRAPVRLPRSFARVIRPPLPTAAPATISGRLHVPDGADFIYVVVRPNGGTEAERSGFEHESAFQIEGLVSGRRYDVEFSGPRIRTLTLIGVVAPAADLDVALELRAVIHVAVGFPRGERCPIDALLVRTHEGRMTKEEGVISFNPDCRFELEAPPRAGQLTIVAEGDDLSLEAAIAIPQHGDPAPICLNPPCRANPLDGQARLRVVLDGVLAHSPISATIVPVDDANSRYGCGSSRFTCEIESLPPGHTFSITASGHGCHGGPVTVTTIEGENEISIPCVPDSPESEPASNPVSDVDS